ncbi:NAD-dependent histone deacetylase sir2, partial [Rhodotorula mucilaginosa]
LYARLKLDPDPRFSTLDDPQDMFDLAFFKHDPSVFYSFAREIYPSNFVPSECHRFVRLLELEGKLLRNYTQNIDGLFEQVGVERMLNCHGSFATASCLVCKRRFPGSFIEPDVYNSRVPLCPYCTPELERLERERELEREERARERERARKRRKVKEGEWDEEEGEGSEEDEEGGPSGEGRSEWSGKAVIKPDIVFFGEPLSDEFDHRLVEDREEVDLLIVMGTSLRVSPVAQLPSHLPHSIPQILINRDPVGHHNFDVCLLGDGDTIVRWLCDELAKKPRAVEEEKEEEEEKDAALALALKKKWSLDERVPLPPHAAAAAASSQKSLDSTSSAAVAAASSNANPNRKEEEDVPGATVTGVVEPEQVGHSHVWLFPGANRDSRWVEAVRVAYGSADAADADADSDSYPDSRVNGEGGTGSSINGDGVVELPASLAPGVIEGEGSDGPNDPDPDPDCGEEDNLGDDDDQEGGNPSSSIFNAAAPLGPASFVNTATTTTATATAKDEDEELQRIAPSFLKPAPNLA